MKHSERIAPTAAVLSAGISIICCLPLGIPAAIGLAGLGMLMTGLWPWMIGLSVLLLAVGLLQLSRSRACQRRSRLSIAVFCVATALVLALALFPQSMASFLADRLP
jgi:hypothetical protein